LKIVHLEKELKDKDEAVVAVLISLKRSRLNWSLREAM
jgi:hypothetical protein